MGRAGTADSLSVHRYGRGEKSAVTCASWRSCNRRMKQANLNLGDPASFLNVYDPDKEVEKVSEFMANGMNPAQVSATLQQFPLSLQA